MRTAKRIISGLIIFSLTAASPAVSARESNSALRQFKTAEGAFFDEFYQAALSLFENFINEFPENDLTAKAELYIARCLYHQKDYAQSLARLKKIRQKDYPQIKNETDYWIAKVFFEKKNFNESVRFLEKITRNDNLDYYLKAKHLQALAYLKINNRDKAKINFKKIIEKSTDPRLIDNSYQNLVQIYREKKDLDKVNSLVTEYLNDNPHGGIIDKMYFYLADNYREKNQFEIAVNYYNFALQKTKTHALRDLIYQGLGLTYLKQKKYALAKRTIDKINNNQLRLFTQGLYYFNSDGYILALDSLGAYINEYPQGDFLPKAYLTKADILYEMGRINDSISLYQTILERFKKPEHFSLRNMAHYGLAWCYLKKQNFSQAIAEFKNTLKYSDDPAVAISSKIQIADVYQAAENFQEALNLYNQVLRDHPYTLNADYIQFQIGMIFIQKRMIDKAFLAFGNLVKNFPDSRLIPEAKYYIAIGYFTQEKYTQAKEALSKLIQKYPNSEIIPEANYLHAKCLFNQEKYRQSLKALKEIATRYKESNIAQLAYIDAGLAYLNLKEFDAAKKIYRDFLKLYPDSEYASSVLFRLGGIYEKENNYQEAKMIYQEAAQSAKNNQTKQEAWLSLGHLAWSNKELEKAKEYFRKGADNQSLLGLKNKLYLAKIKQHTNQTNKALEIYQQLIESESDIADIALVNKAFLFKNDQNYPKAIEFFRRCLDKKITSAEIRFALAICLERTGLDQEALEQYFQLIYTHPSELDYKVRAYFRIANLYEKQNNFSQAQQAYKRVIDLDVAESRIAQKRLERLDAQR